ncbi:hypothetical protein OAT16_07535, partial [Prolixibacteraceae bacterium]|nr:hypothetical protein [Prolixibacteraceae bacterium]
IRFSRFQRKTKISNISKWIKFFVIICSLISIFSLAQKGNLTKYLGYISTKLDITDDNRFGAIAVWSLVLIFILSLITIGRKSHRYITKKWSNRQKKSIQIFIYTMEVLSFVGLLSIMVNITILKTLLYAGIKASFILFPFLIILCSFYYLFEMIYIGIYKGHWKKLELKLGKIQSEHQVSGSIINENIHDILVLFHNAKLDVVVFEDIDRLSNAMDIFTKLRELNETINRSHEIQSSDKRPIKFIYALRDDLIEDPENRAKVFDLNIAVIPFNTGDNAINQISEHVHKNIPTIDHSELDQLIREYVHDNKEYKILNYKDNTIFPIDSYALIQLSYLLSDNRAIKTILNDFTIYWNQNIKAQWNQLLVDKLLILQYFISLGKSISQEISIIHFEDNIKFTQDTLDETISNLNVIASKDESESPENINLEIVIRVLIRTSIDITNKTTELFALMVFKLLFAKEFSDIHKPNSLLRYIFNDGKEAIKKYSESEINQLKGEVHFSIVNEPTCSIEELITDYDSEKFPKAERKYLDSGSNNISIEIIIKRKLFTSIEGLSIKEIHQGEVRYNVSTFISKLMSIDDFNTRNRLMKIKEKYLLKYKSNKFDFSFSNKSLQEINNKLKELDIPFSWELLLGEYHNTINPTQIKYLQLILLDETLIQSEHRLIISGNNKFLPESDREFLSILNTNIEIPPNYTIINPKLLLQFVKKEQFSAIQMINIDIISYLASHSHESTNKISNKEIVETYIASTIIQNENKEWMQEFYLDLLHELTNDNRYDHSFKQHCIIVPILNNTQSTLFDKLLSNYKTQSRFIAYLFKDNDLAESISFRHPKLEKRSKLQDVLENEMDQFYLLNFDDQQLHNFINWANNDLVNLKFKNCIYMTDLIIQKDNDTPRKIMKAVYENNLYRINSKMIKTMILFNNHISKTKYEFDALQRHNKDEYIEELIPKEHWEQDKYQGAFENSNYKFILSLKDKPVNQKLIDYIEANRS